MGEDDRDNEFEREYSDDGFWTKVRRYAKAAGIEVVERALQLYYAAQSPDTPAWAKRVIYGALGYFVLPADAIPDFIPAAGYADDLGALVMALASVAFYITPAVREKAHQKLDDWFG
jgi:uncharacterized membrane protein YkvA (DUF1232 family)